MNNLVLSFYQINSFWDRIHSNQLPGRVHTCNIQNITAQSTLSITVVDADIVSQIPQVQYTSNKEILYADFNVKHIKFDDERNLNQEKTSHTQQKSSERANFPLWLYFLSKKVNKQKVNLSQVQSRLRTILGQNGPSNSKLQPIVYRSQKDVKYTTCESGRPSNQKVELYRPL